MLTLDAKIEDGGSTTFYIYLKKINHNLHQNNDYLVGFLSKKWKYLT